MAKISILGASSSTYEGWIPEGNRTYYQAGSLGGVHNTWWYPLISNGRNTLVVNNSWSGSRVTDTKTDEPLSQAILRVPALKTATETPDVVFLYMGVNDLTNNVSCEPWDGVINTSSHSTFANAYARLIREILVTYPGVKIYCFTLGFCGIKGNNYNYVNDLGFDNNDFNRAIMDVASYFSCPIVRMHEDGLNIFNNSLYGGIHPNAQGMKLRLQRVANDITEGYTL